MATVYIRDKKQLKAALLPLVEKSIKETQIKINDVIQQTINEYYAEYPKPPRIYKRTNQFLHSLFISKVNVSGNHVTASVELNDSFLNLIYNTRTGFSGKDVAEWADEGFHGKAKSDGTHFWEKAYEQQLGGDLGILDLLIKNLEKNGINFS